MRDAIVYSGSGWESCNVMERLSIALTKLGAKVLYCDNPVSRLKGKPPEMHEVESGIFRFRPTIFGHRLNEIPACLRSVGFQLGAVHDAWTRIISWFSAWMPLFLWNDAS